MANSFLPYGRQTITESDIAAVVEVLRSSFLTQGPAVPAFEQAVAARVDASFAVAVNSATSALHIACLALGLKPGDRLWTSPITFVASANCGRYCGAEVDFVDIDISTGLISISALEEKLKIAELDGKLPKILIPVHLAGSSCDMAAISKLSDQYGFYVIEDASHAIGGSYNSHSVGSCRYSSITVFSFHPVKIITSGEGGMALTNNPELALRMTELRSHGIVRDASRFKSIAEGPWIYEQQNLGFNYRMSDIHAALGLSQLNRLEEIVLERNRLLKYYISITDGLPFNILRIPDNVKSSVHLAILSLIDVEPAKHREVFEGLRAIGIGVQLHYSPVHLHPYYRYLGFSNGDYPSAELYAKSSFSVPLFPGLTTTEIETIVSSTQNLLF